MRRAGWGPAKKGPNLLPQGSPAPRLLGWCSMDLSSLALGARLWWLWRFGDRKFGGFQALMLVGFANTPPGTTRVLLWWEVGRRTFESQTQLPQDALQTSKGGGWKELRVPGIS